MVVDYISGWSIDIPRIDRLLLVRAEIGAHTRSFWINSQNAWCSEFWARPFDPSDPYECLGGEA